MKIRLFSLHQENGAIHFLYQVQFLRFINLSLYFQVCFFFTFNKESNCVTFSFLWLWYIFLSMAKYNLLTFNTYFTSYYQWLSIGTTLIIDDQIYYPWYYPILIFRPRKDETLSWPSSTRIFGELIVWVPRGKFPGHSHCSPMVYQLYYSFMKALKKKLTLPLFYCLSQEIRLWNLRKLICTDQSRSCKNKI